MKKTISSGKSNPYDMHDCYLVNGMEGRGKQHAANIEAMTAVNNMFAPIEIDPYK